MPSGRRGSGNDAPNVAGMVTFDSVAIITTDGGKVPISALGPAEEMREAIMGWRSPKEIEVAVERPLSMHAMRDSSLMGVRR